MKKIIVSAFLVATCLSVCVSSAFAVAGELAVGVASSIAGEVISVWLSSSASKIQKESALASYKDHWESSLPESSGTYSNVSYNELSAAVFSLNEASQPARIVYSSIANGYVIEAAGPFGYHSYSTSNGFATSTIWNNTGKYFCTPMGYVFRAHFNTDSLISSISSKVDSLATNITQLMASNGYLASINNKLASLTSISTKLDTISDLLNANTYCCGYTTNSSGAEFPTQSISFSIAEQIVARLNSEMQGKNLTVLKRDGSGTTTSTFRRAYVNSSSMICLVMSGGTYYLCDPTNTIFKAGSDRLSNIYSKVNSMATTLTNIAGSIDTVESKLSTLATKLDTLHTDNSTIVGGIDTVSAKISGVVSKLDTLHTDAASVISAIKALPDYSDKLDTITELLTTNTYTCGYLTDAGGTAYGTIPISYDSAEAIVARLNTQLPGKQITYLPREGAPYASDFDYCALDSSLYIRVYSGQYSYYLCDSGNRLYKASADRVSVIDARLVSINNILTSLGQKLDKLPTSYPLPDLTTIESAALGLENMVGSTYEIMSDLKARLDGLEVIVVGGEPTDLTTIESTLSNLDSNISQLHTDNIGLVGVINTMNNTLGDLNVKLGDLKTSLGGLEVNITGGSSGSADLTKVESALSTIIDKMDNLPASVDNIVVNITQDNDAYNVFYVEDENGDKKSVTSVAGDSLSASGKLLQFLYKLVIGSALDNVDDSIGGLGGFFFDDAPSGLGEGVTVWD